MKNSTPLFALMQQAVALHQKGRIAEAETAYRKVLAQNPKHFDALRLLGGLYIQNNNPESAIACLQAALGTAPDHPELLNNLGVAFSSQGRLNDALLQYQQVIKIAPNHVNAIDNLGNIYYNAGKLDDAIAWLERSIQLKEDNPRAHAFLGHAYRLQNKTAEAVAHYRRALELWPDHEEILVNLGNLLRAAGQSVEARTIYERLAALKPGDAPTQLNLGVIHRDSGDFAAALAQYDTALRLKPDSTDALVNRASLLIELDRPAEASAAYDAALTLNANLQDARWGKSLALLMQGDYEAGWRLYEARFAYKPKAGPAPRVPRWDGAPLAGKRLLIWGEQGLGDVLQFMRYAKLCKAQGGTIILQCDRSLVRLFRECPFIDEVLASVTEPDFDYQIPVMSLPYVFGTTFATIPAEVPYLFVSPEARGQWSPRFAAAGGFKVGLVWAGNPRKSQIDAHTTDRHRSVTLAALQPVLQIAGCRFYNLQKGAASGQIADADLSGKLIDYMPEVDDFMDTAALIENLDLVISVDTSVVHLTGGLGKPVWVLSRFGGCWRWLRNRETNPWYPTARIFAPPAPGDWQNCIARVASALKDQA